MLSALTPAVDVDAVLLVPLERIEPELAGVLEAAEDGGQQDAVVGAVRLGAEHANVEAIRVAGQDFLDHLGPGHAGADHHQRVMSLTYHACLKSFVYVSRSQGVRERETQATAHQMFRD